MSTTSLLRSTSTSSGGSTSNSRAETCFNCPPVDQHTREWTYDPSITSRKRTLVLCFDGTGDSFDSDNSNVVQFLAMLKKDDPAEQLVYYQAGIGTYTGNNVIGTPIIQGTSQLLDKMIAWNLPGHIKDGYQFLMQNYHPGDQICIFGFSRGAFTARALAGMLQKVGLLPQCNVEQLPFAYDMYARDDAEGLNLSIQFKRTFSIDVKIKFVGIWDTVQSVGLIPKHLPFSGSNTAIEYFRHALALDERRVKFIPYLWIESPKPKVKGTEASEPNGSISQDRRRKAGKQELSGSGVYENGVNAKGHTDVDEVFFAGAHCDVGGGSVKNEIHHSLARIPLRWMIRECFKARSGIIFDKHMLKYEVGLDFDFIFKAPGPLPSENRHLERPGKGEIKGFRLRSVPVAIFSGLTLPPRWVWGKVKKLFVQEPRWVESPRDFKYEGEDHEELNDALSPIYDQLNRHWYWKLMEWFPSIIKKQSAEIAGSNQIWAYKLVWNRGRGRVVYKSLMRRGVEDRKPGTKRIRVHKSVKIRMLAQPMFGSKKQYRPKVRCMINGKPQRLPREEWLADEPQYIEWVN